MAINEQSSSITEDLVKVTLQDQGDVKGLEESMFVLPPNDRASIKYHPDTPEEKLKGRLGHLTVDEEAVLEEMIKKVDQGKITLSRIQIPGEPLETLLLRFLRARDFVLKDALEMLNDSLAWRLENNVHTISANDMTGLFKVPHERVLECYPYFFCGMDKLGRPLAVDCTGKLQVKELLKNVTIDEYVRYFIWSCEYGNRVLAKHWMDTGYFCEDRSIIMDCRGASQRLMGKTVIDFVKIISKINGNNYPETLGTMTVVNAPKLFSIGWKLVYKVIDPVTRKKFNVIGSDQKKIYTALSEIIDNKYILEEYGGKLKLQNVRGRPCHVRTENVKQMSPMKQAMLSGVTTTKEVFDKKQLTDVYFYEE